MRGAARSFCLYGLGLAVVVLSAGRPLLASTVVAAPEIDGSMFATALGVLAAGALILRSRFKK